MLVLLKLEIPSAKHQRSSRFQAPLWVFDVWKFSGAWMLEFGFSKSLCLRVSAVQNHSIFPNLPKASQPYPNLPKGVVRGEGWGGRLNLLLNLFTPILAHLRLFKGFSGKKRLFIFLEKPNALGL